MSRGGGNPNWEWQLISPLGHTSDLGLRQRAMVAGFRPPSKPKVEKPKPKKPRKQKEPRFNLALIFKGK